MRRHTLLALIPIASAFAVAAQSPGPAPRLDAWTIIGPGGGGTMIAPAISPHDPSLVLEHCDMTGAYITQDGGLSWRIFNLRSGIETFAFDPSNPKRIFAGGDALWRSDDTGRTWSMLFPNPSKKTMEHQTGDHSDYSLTSNDGNYVTASRIRQIVVDPRESNIVHIAFSDPSHGGTTILLSKDGGASFHQEHELYKDRILLLLYTPTGRIAIGKHGIYRGRDWAPKPITEPGETIFQASAGLTEGRAILYATTSAGNLFVSEDEGRSWQLRNPVLGQQSGSFEAIAAAGKNGQVAYIGFRSLKLGDRPEDLYNGIARTVDAGRNWSIVFKESTHPASNLDAAWIEERAQGTTWEGGRSIIFDAPYSLAVAPGNPDICYATDLFRTYRTLDGGKTWSQVYSAHAEGNRWTTRGLDVTTNYGVHFDPFDPKHLFIDYTDIGAFSSPDGGHSWESATEGIPEPWRNTTYWLAFDPEVKGLMWGAFSGTHDLPRPKMWRSNEAPANFRGGVAVSTDGGRHWTPSNTGMIEAAITHILLDPASPPGMRTLYACALGVGVYKSSDNGKTWQLKNDGITEGLRFAWRIVRGNDGSLYLILARRNNGIYGKTTGGGALYKSTDGADHWTKLSLPDGVNGPNGLALDPRDNRRIYLAAWGQERTGSDVGGGVYLSTDGALTWKPIFNLSQHVYDLTIDAKAPDTLYICGFDAGAYRSTDAGIHWTRIQGFNFKWGHRVILDPADPSKIYITTYGGSVWHGPAAGDPNSSEDITTPVPVAH